MIIMKKEIKTAAGVVTIVASRADPSYGYESIKYTASIEVDGGVCVASKIVHLPETLIPEVYDHIERDLLDDLAEVYWEDE